MPANAKSMLNDAEKNKLLEFYKLVQDLPTMIE